MMTMVDGDIIPGQERREGSKCSEKFCRSSHAKENDERKKS